MAAVVVALVVAAAVLVLWRVTASGEYVASPGSAAADGSGGAGTSGTGAQPAGASRVLADLVAALDERDADAAAALAGPDAAPLLRAVTANAAALDVADLAMRYVDEVGAVEDGTWSAAVEVSWSFAGVDPGAAREEVLVSFHAGADGVRLVGVGGGERRTPLWLAGPLEVRRAGTTLVLATDADRADLLLARAEEAVQVVGRVLPSWTGPLVVEAPADQQQLEASLAAEPGSYDNVAAVTATVDGSVRADAPLHVFVNPGVYDTLDPVGAQVVLSHEATHVATQAPLRVVPVWLLEGFADHVALRDVDLPLSTTAGQVTAEVRQDGAPAALPDQADFDAASDRFGAAYEAAWLACEVLADRAGEQALVDVYTAVSDGEPLAEALQESAGLSVADLTRSWQRRLEALAR